MNTIFAYFYYEYRKYTQFGSDAWYARTPRRKLILLRSHETSLCARTSRTDARMGSDKKISWKTSVDAQWWSFLIGNLRMRGLLHWQISQMIIIIVSTIICMPSWNIPLSFLLRIRLLLSVQYQQESTILTLCKTYADRISSILVQVTASLPIYSIKAPPELTLFAYHCFSTHESWTFLKKWLRCGIKNGKDHWVWALQSVIHLFLPKICQRCHGKTCFERAVAMVRGFVLGK